MIEIPNFKGKFYNNYPLAQHTTWRIGGNAEAFAIPDDLDDLLYLLAEVKRAGIPLFVLGQGSNVLVDDAGLPGITIRLGKCFRYQTVEAEALRVGAGLWMPSLAKKTAELGFAGYEFLIGIPGTVGAGTVINAGKGTDGRSDIKSILQSVTYIDRDLHLVSAGVQELEMGYRSSQLREFGALVVEAKFHLQARQDPGEILASHRSILAERRAKFPLNLPNTGSVFKRPQAGPPAGWLIESAGLKGYRVGDAQVSPMHANFIVNVGRATSAEVKKLIDMIIEKVFQVHRISLEREVIYLPEQSLWR